MENLGNCFYNRDRLARARPLNDLEKRNWNIARLTVRKQEKGWHLVFDMQSR